MPKPHDVIDKILREKEALTSLLGMALVGLRTAVKVHGADDQVLLNVEAGLRERDLDPDELHANATRPD